MGSKEVYCPACPRFDSELGRCGDGKVNPSSWTMAVEVANLMGVRALCPFHAFRERLAQSRHGVVLQLPTGSESNTA
jgi:hypothetical protein